MAADESESGNPGPIRLTDRRFLVCPQCGWVHYAMTQAEEEENAQELEYLTGRYELSPKEQELYALAYRQCLRCESPAAAFRAAQARDLDRAGGALVTPVCVRPQAVSH